MKYNKGFTLTELIVSFALLTILSLSLFRTVLSVQKMQKRDIFINQFKALTVELNNEIQNDFNSDKITSVAECGDNCYDITFEKKGNVRVSIDREKDIITYGSLKEKLPEDYKLYDDLKINQYTSTTKGFNSYFALTIPIKSTLDINLSGLKYIYMYDSTGTYELYIPKAVSNRKCTYDGSVYQGTEFVDGQYTYRYMSEYDGDASDWVFIDKKGWGVTLTDKDSTDPVTTKLCTQINNIPIISMRAMFYGSKASSIDVSSFDTSSVTNMRTMFTRASATILDLSNFDTSNVTNMRSMFYESKANILNVSSFNTSKVTNMYKMFYDSAASNVNLSSFDTSNVTNMYGMFNKSKMKTINITNFNTSKVTNMYAMFGESEATQILWSNKFDTSNVTNMSSMFYKSKAKQLNLSNFNTSKVTNMQAMFNISEATSLDLSSFDTSKVTNMSWMFQQSKAISINLSSFNTSKVTTMEGMFHTCLVPELDLTSFDTSKVTNMKWMFRSSRSSTIDLSSFDTSAVTDKENMFYSSLATLVYARNASEVTALSTDSGKPSTMTIRTK